MNILVSEKIMLFYFKFIYSVCKTASLCCLKIITFANSHDCVDVHWLVEAIKSENCICVKFVMEYYLGKQIVHVAD